MLLVIVLTAAIAIALVLGKVIVILIVIVIVTCLLDTLLGIASFWGGIGQFADFVYGCVRFTWNFYGVPCVWLQTTLCSQSNVESWATTNVIPCMGTEFNFQVKCTGLLLRSSN